VGGPIKTEEDPRHRWDRPSLQRFYGSPDDAQVEAVQKRRFPKGKPGIYNVVDDDPAPVREWLPALAPTIGAKPPRHVPRWLARRLAGDGVVAIVTECRGASNAKAKRELGRRLRYPTWRQGIAASYRSVNGLR
jgi:nucleoside-diphosphate-sugar epimerase